MNQTVFPHGTLVYLNSVSGETPSLRRAVCPSTRTNRSNLIWISVGSNAAAALAAASYWSVHSFSEVAVVRYLLVLLQFYHV
jgi:hypothetical protein